MSSVNSHNTSLIKVFILIFISVASFQMKGQQKNIPLNRNFQQEIERTLLKDSSIVHSGMKPYLESQLNLEHTYYFETDTIKKYGWLGRRLYQNHFLEIKKDDYFLAVDPLFDFTGGKDFANNTTYGDQLLYINQRGAQLIGDIGKKFSFQTCFYETQAVVPSYLKAFCANYGIYPGFGRTKAFGDYGFDFSMSNGWLSYSPIKQVNIQFGQGKNFYGHGYRSLLLSDAAFSYPYLKATVSFFHNKLQYSAMYASLQSLQRLPKDEVPESLFKRKAASVNYLSWMPFKGLELGLFESIIWEKYNDTDGTLPTPYGAYVPIIGVNTALNKFEDGNNVMVGMNVKVKTSRHSFVYGQFALDDPSRAIYGYQIGAKYFDLFAKNLDLQLEFNSLEGNMYAHQPSLESYTHFYQPLGHPTGPNTREILGILNYRYKRFIFQGKCNFLRHYTGPTGSWANYPALIWSNFPPWPYQWTTQLDVNAGFVFNPKTNFQILVGITQRSDKIDYALIEDATTRTNYLYVSLRTNLLNRYVDF